MRKRPLGFTTKKTRRVSSLELAEYPANRFQLELQKLEAQVPAMAIYGGTFAFRFLMTASQSSMNASSIHGGPVIL